MSKPLHMTDTNAHPLATEEVVGMSRFGTLEEHVAGALGVMAQPGFMVELLKYAIPTGLISIWSGEIDSIPQGWALCDGINGTPDLRDRFVLGAGGTRAVGTTAGTQTHLHSVTVGDTTLTTAQMPVHSHSPLFPQTKTNTDGGCASGYNQSSVNLVSCGSPTLRNTIGTTSSVGSGGSHTHTASSAYTDHMPPFYTLAYIMKL